MKRSALHDAYRAYLEGKTSLDEVLERFRGQPPAGDPPSADGRE